MTKKPRTFDWKESPAHLGLLSSFLKPRDIDQVVGWQYLRETLGESSQDAIERFIREGMLIPGELEECMDRYYTVADLKRMLKALGLKMSGTKPELIERLVTADRQYVDNAFDRSRLLKCSPDGAELVERLFRERQRDADLAKAQTYEALLRGEVKTAYKAHLSYARKYLGQDYLSRPYLVNELEFVLSCKPKVLGDITEDSLQALRAAVCLVQIWHDEHVVNWLADSLETPLQSPQVAARYLARHAEIYHRIASANEYAKKFQMVFEPGDVDSCQLCMALKSSVFEKDQLPELPVVGCQSETGCMCHFESIYDESDDDFEVDLEESEAAGFDLDPADPIRGLKLLKQMLELELITQADYDAKKAEVLSRI